jgi:transposase
MLAAIALANKLARQLWAMLMKHIDYQDPDAPVAA